MEMTKWRSAAIDERGDGRTLRTQINTGICMKFSLDLGLSPCCCFKNTDSETSKFFVKALQEEGIDVKRVDTHGRTALHDAAESTWKLGLIQALLELGADVTAKTNRGETALHLAAANFVGIKSLSIIKALLVAGVEAGLNVNGVNEDDETPLHALIHKLSIKQPKVLCSCGKKSGFRTCVDDISDVLFLFYQYNVNFEAKTRHGQTALDIAMKESKHIFDPHIIFKLITLGSMHVKSLYTCKNLQYPGKRTLLHQACEYKAFEVVEFIVKKGAKINALDDDNKTPLFYAIKRGNARIVQFLLILSSDVNVIAKDGSNILSNLSREKPETVWRIIIEHLAKEQSLENSLHPNLLQTLSENYDYRNYLDKCKLELDGLKKDEISAASSLTWFNLQTDPRDKLLKYTENKDLVLEFENTNFSEKYPIYGARIKHRFSTIMANQKVLLNKKTKAK